jgi:hypothetical protein
MLVRGDLSPTITEYRCEHSVYATTTAWLRDSDLRHIYGSELAALSGISIASLRRIDPGRWRSPRRPFTVRLLKRPSLVFTQFF